MRAGRASAGLHPEPEHQDPTGTHISPAKLSTKAEAKAAAMKTALSGFGSSSAAPVPPPSEVALDDTDVGLARRVFRVRRDMNDSTECEVIDATLWALGDYAAIWVDGDVPINEYNDCSDTEACEEAESCYEESEYDAHGFDNWISRPSSASSTPTSCRTSRDCSAIPQTRTVTAASVSSSHRSSMPSR